ncbi:MAG: STAS domain-containing protein [Acidobacteriales bacterium]|nr:STAS domain-containing protein [Terriglobales bacterium]
MVAVLEKRGDAVVIKLKGKLLLGESVDEFRSKWQDAVTAGARNVVVDISGVPVMDSTGIGSLMRCQASLSSPGGKLRLVGANKVIRQALRVTRLEKLFEFHDNEASALASLEKAASSNKQ